MLRRVVFVKTDVSEELSASFIKVTRMDELGTTLAVTSNRCTLLVTASVVPSSPVLVTLMEALRCSDTSVLTRTSVDFSMEFIFTVSSLSLHVPRISVYFLISEENRPASVN
jgi:hypothetical protein